MEQIKIKKIDENERYEFYAGGMHREAVEIQQRIREEQQREGVLVLHGVHGWCVRIEKEAV